MEPEGQKPTGLSVDIYSSEEINEGFPDQTKHSDCCCDISGFPFFVSVGRSDNGQYHDLSLQYGLWPSSSTSYRRFALPEGKMFFAIRGAVTQYEREKIRERSMRESREKARQGKVLGGSCAPPILPESLFESAQRKLDRNRELAKRNIKREYLLSGLLICSFCKSWMIGHNIRGVSYYRCNHRYNPDRIPFGPDGEPEPCVCREIRANVIEPEVWNTVCQLIKDPDVLIQELRNRDSESSETRESMERELQLCPNRLKAIPLEQKRLVEGYRKGMYPDFMMKEEMERVEKEKAELDAREAELQRQLEKA